jgi:integrase
MNETDMDFLTLCNKRLDYVKGHHTNEHFRHVLYHVKRWIKEWNGLSCSEISNEMAESYINKRARVSSFTANKELIYLRATFNYGNKKSLITHNPTKGIDFFPVKKRKRYVPPKQDVYKVISLANPDAQDYLWSIVLTAARMNEINNLKWDDVDFSNKSVTLWTRKKKGGNCEPRDVPMVSKLYDILIRRFDSRDTTKPWVFWHTYWSRKSNQMISGPYGDRKSLMKKLCNKANVKYFRYHPLRHFTASILDDLGIPIGVIQRILGHENRKTTEGYLHSVGQSERNAMNELEQVDIFSAPLNNPVNQPSNMHPEYWIRKVDRPDYQTLVKDINDLGYLGAGKKYGVSDNAIRKWKKHYESHFKN